MNYSVQGYYVFGYLMISHEALSLAQILTSNRCFDNYRFWIVDLETHVPWELNFNEFCTFSTSVQTSKAVVMWCILCWRGAVCVVWWHDVVCRVVVYGGDH